MKRRRGARVVSLAARAVLELPLEIVRYITKFLDLNRHITFDINRPIYRNRVLRGWAGTQRRRNQEQVCSRFWSYQTGKHVGLLYGPPEGHFEQNFMDHLFPVNPAYNSTPLGSAYTPGFFSFLQFGAQ